MVLKAGETKPAPPSETQYFQFVLGPAKIRSGSSKADGSQWQLLTSTLQEDLLSDSLELDLVARLNCLQEKGFCQCF